MDLDPDNALPYELLHWLVNENLRPLAPALWADATARTRQEERLAALRRVCVALTDSDVLDMLYPSRSKDREQKARDGRPPSD